MKRTNLSIFIPHLGCPFCCSFCNQNVISGTQKSPTITDVEQILIEQQPILEKNNMSAEIAFFGGSFTAIEQNYMNDLLDIARRFCDDFPMQFHGIRCSTRPDFIDENILEILKKYGVTSIELGAQSMNNDVLLMNNRGHTTDDIRNSSRLIKSFGFSLGLQMMTGLYGANFESDLKTAQEFIALKPDTVRVYPTVVLKNTRLATLVQSGGFHPYSFEKSVKLCAEILRMFTKNNVKIIRLGLHASDFVEKDFISGTYHPAFREICESRIFLEDILDEIKLLKGKSFVIYTESKNLSKIIGQKRCNIEFLQEKGYRVIVKKLDNTRLKVVENRSF